MEKLSGLHMQLVVKKLTNFYQQVDDNIGLLMSELNQTGLWGRINLVVTSDHGMAQCSADRLIRLDDCLHPENYTLVDVTPIAALIPNGGNQVKQDFMIMFSSLFSCYFNT